MKVFRTLFQASHIDIAITFIFHHLFIGFPLLIDIVLGKAFECAIGRIDFLSKEAGQLGSIRVEAEL